MSINFAKLHINLWDLFLWILLGCVGILTAFLLYKYFQFNKFPTEKGELGQFGDFIGGSLNPLVALAALFAVMRSIALQKTELAATNLALKEQAETAQKQQRSQQFFDLIRIYEKAFEDANAEKNLENFLYKICDYILEIIHIALKWMGCLGSMNQNSTITSLNNIFQNPNMNYFQFIKTICSY